jgi:outer membrane receptor for Fe3+-dicitrate
VFGVLKDLSERKLLMKNSKRFATATAVVATTAYFGMHVAAHAQQTSSGPVEEVVVLGETGVTFANSSVTDSMVEQQTPITSALAVIDNLPGVSIQEGDTYGFDDWSTTVSMRGFQVSLDDQQLGMTVDGMPNGNSNYGGGAKANRYIDTLNLGGVLVSQGTADVASRSNEALGGTLDFITDDPIEEQRMLASITQAEFEGQKYYLRYDTGYLFDSDMRAWFSISHQYATDWVNASAENERDHIAAKFMTSIGDMGLTGYLSYDDTHEDNYQRLFSPEDFAANPEWDQLTDVWTGLPYVDQLYRKGWSTLRKNTFGYLKLDSGLTDTLTLSAGVYYHDNYGRGDWVPPYLVDVTDDAGGPESEFLGAPTVRGGDFLGQLFFVDPQGNLLTPAPGCESSILFPYGGAGPEYDPACYPANAIPVQSYRHTHYGKERTGLTLDFEWIPGSGRLNNRIRGGLWYEDYDREESRDWHKISDTRVGFEDDNVPYWVQYDRDYPVETVKLYLAGSFELGPATISLGAKKFLVDLERTDLIGDTPNASVDSDSDVLGSIGVVLQTPIDGLEIFASYAENFKAFSDVLLERPTSDFSSLEPETSENVDFGVRYESERFFVAASYYDISFENRIIFIDNQDVSGPNFLIGTDGTYFNAGGIESNGVEVSGSVLLTDSISLYLSYTNNESTYLGTGADQINEELGLFPGNRVVGVPEDMFVTTLDWSSGPVRFGVSQKNTGDRYVNFSNTWKLDSYSTTDLYFGLSGDVLSALLSNLDFRIQVNNVFDEDYLGGIAGQGAWIGAPRTVSFTATGAF